ncbi:MAG: dihydroorotate dehydrogenase [Ferrimicrobium sp.]
MRRRIGSSGVDLRTTLGDASLANPIMTASGTAGHGAEFAAFVDLAGLGAHVVKSLATFASEGNLAPRLAPIPTGMINSVGLPGPGVSGWIRDYLPGLRRLGIRPVVSLWGRSAQEFGQAARDLAPVASDVMFVEVNVSCPNTEAGSRLFAHSPSATAQVVHEVRGELDLALFVKLSPNTDRYEEVAAAALEAGATGLTAINTVFGQWRAASGLGVLGTAQGGGISGRGIHPIALRIVESLRRAFPATPLIGVGGVATGSDALRMLRAGADAVQVGTASFVDPRRVSAVVAELAQLIYAEGFTSWQDYRSAIGKKD